MLPRARLRRHGPVRSRRSGPRCPQAGLGKVGAPRQPEPARRPRGTSRRQATGASSCAHASRTWTWRQPARQRRRRTRRSPWQTDHHAQPGPAQPGPGPASRHDGRRWDLDPGFTGQGGALWTQLPGGGPSRTPLFRPVQGAAVAWCGQLGQQRAPRRCPVGTRRVPSTARAARGPRLAERRARGRLEEWAQQSPRQRPGSRQPGGRPSTGHCASRPPPADGPGAAPRMPVPVPSPAPRGPTGAPGWRAVPCSPGTVAPGG